MNIPAQVEKTISEFALANKNQTILVGVSGGIDSIVLAYSLQDLGYKIGLAHVNHNLRGKESDGDEEFVQRFAKELGVEFFVSIQSIEGTATQEEARKKRYKWFKEIKGQHGFDHIALGHNADDNFETALFHLIKGEGILNHRGIPIQSQEFIRPLLFCSKSEIHAFAKEKNLQWREDKSNKEEKYHRNLLRNQVLPLLRKINPSIEKTYQRDYKRELTAREILIPILELSRDWLIEENGNNEIDLKLLKEIPGWFLSLEYFLKSIGYRSEQEEELRKFLEAGPGSKFLIGDHELIMDREKVFISRSAEKEKLLSISESDLPSSIEFGGKNFLLTIEEFNQEEKLEKEGVEYIDYEKLSWPLNIRPWKGGDSFQPLGMSGKKKISDLLIDKKIPLSKKTGMHVLLSGDKIALVIGVQLSEVFKIEKSTGQVLVIKEQP